MKGGFEKMERNRSKRSIDLIAKMVNSGKV